MRVFLCLYNGFSLAIPMDFVSSIFLINDNPGYRIHYDNEKRNTYLSLPMLFNCPVINIHHGMVLKNENNESDTFEDKIILLTTEIIKEREIPAEKFYSIPKTLGVYQFASIFKGIFFHPQRIRSNTLSNISAGDMVLLLNPQQLVQNIQKELPV